MSNASCPNCGGAGRIKMPGRLGPKCGTCGGTGYLPEHSFDFKIRQEGVFRSLDEDEENPPTSVMGLVPVPENRPHIAVFDANPNMRPQYTYQIELPFEGVLLHYSGVPVEEHDCMPGKILIRFDRAIYVSARKP